MNDYLEQIVSPDNRIIKYGQLDEKVLLELKMTTSLYDYIQVITDYYDEEDHPYFNNWTDIEGMGYGWAWLNYEEKDWHKMMEKIVSSEADSLSRIADEIFYIVHENENEKIYQFIHIEGIYREDIIITFSNNEIEF